MFKVKNLWFVKIIYAEILISIKRLKVVTRNLINMFPATDHKNSYHGYTRFSIDGHDVKI